jgi:hypothetical protein
VAQHAKGQTMQADIEQDIDGKLWLLVGYDGQTGKTY